MPRDDGTSLSRSDFDRVIERALTLDHEGGDRVDLAQARAIAGELGISTAAWESALREHGHAGASATTLALPVWRDGALSRMLVIAVAGLVAGGVMGAINPQQEWSLAFGAAAIVAGMSVAASGLRRHAVGHTLVELAAWWGGVTIGIFAGMLQVHGDPMVFGVLSWIGCAAFAMLLARFRRGSPAGVSPD